MDKDQSSIPERRHSNYNLRIIFSSIALLIVFVMELYTMINYSDNYIVLGVFALLMVLSFYVLITSIIQLRFARQLRAEEQYDSIFKSEKASYLLLRKNFDEIAERLDTLEKNVALPSEGIMNAQKALAKVAINRSKENADTLINSSQQMMERIDTFDAILSANNDELFEKQKQLFNENNQQYILKQQELLTSLKEVEANIKSDLLQTMARTPVAVTIPQSEPVVGTVPAPQPKVKETPIEVAEAVEEAPIEVEKLVEEAPIEVEELVEEAPIDVEELVEEAPIEVEELVEEDPIEVEEAVEETPIEVEEAVEEAPIEVEETVEEAPIEVEEPAEEKPPIPDLSDPNKKMSADEIAAMFANADAIAPAVEEPTPEPVIEEKPPLPDLSDPNKKMSADEIAAMFANADAIAPAVEESTPEPVVEEPVVEEAQTEEKAPMPDLSDPNKMLSPEEIAALISNM